MSLLVLIVEDEFFIALDLQDQVETLGYRVTGAARDLEGCKRAAMKERPDVALMDIRLAGGSSGIDAARWLHDEVGVRCIFISGNLDDATRESLSGMRPVAFIRKPILTHQLERALVDCSQQACSASGK